MLWLCQLLHNLWGKLCILRPLVTNLCRIRLTLFSQEIPFFLLFIQAQNLYLVDICLLPWRHWYWLVVQNTVSMLYSDWLNLQDSSLWLVECAGLLPLIGWMCRTLASDWLNVQNASLWFFEGAGLLPLISWMYTVMVPILLYHQFCSTLYWSIMQVFYLVIGQLQFG